MTVLSTRYYTWLKIACLPSIENSSTGKQSRSRYPRVMNKACSAHFTRADGDAPQYCSLLSLSLGCCNVQRRSTGAY